MARLEIGNLAMPRFQSRMAVSSVAIATTWPSPTRVELRKVAVFGTPDTGSGAKISTLEVTNDLYVGSNGLGELRVGVDLAADLSAEPLGVGHATISVGSDLRIGTAAANQLDNIAYISGPNTSVTVSNVLYAGENGKGTLELRDGATLSAASPRVGSGAMSNGTLVVTGTGTTMTATNNSVIGTNGTALQWSAMGPYSTMPEISGLAIRVTRTVPLPSTMPRERQHKQHGKLEIGGRTDGSGGTGVVTIQNGGRLKFKTRLISAVMPLPAGSL